MTRIRVDFTVEPFTEGVLGPHVAAALDALRRIGYAPDVGPFGTAVEGDAADVWPAVDAAAVAAFGAGATGLSVSAHVVRTPAEGSGTGAAAGSGAGAGAGSGAGAGAGSGSGAGAGAAAGSGAGGAGAAGAGVAWTGVADAGDFIAALHPVARALGTRVIAPEDIGPSDVPLVWRGQVVGALDAPGRPHDLREGLGRLVTQIETELGGTLAELPRVAKQRAVRLLDERGAFAFRNSVDEVADAMGVSRVTVYNYLNATRSDG